MHNTISAEGGSLAELGQAACGMKSFSAIYFPL